MGAATPDAAPCNWKRQLGKMKCPLTKAMLGFEGIGNRQYPADTGLVLCRGLPDSSRKLDQQVEDEFPEGVKKVVGEIEHRR